MPEDKTDSTERKLVAIHSIADTEGGRAIVGFLDEMVEQAKNDLVNSIRADDFAQIAGAQSTVKTCEVFKWFLTSDLETLLSAFNIEHSDEENDDEDG